MNEPPSAREQEPQYGPPYGRQLLILFIVSGAILVFIAVVIIVYLGLRGREAADTPTPTPTDMVSPTATAFVSPVPAPSCETIISSGDVEISMALPVSLAADGVTYPVEPIVPQQDAWTYPAERSGEAVWVCGTVVNYVVGLEPSVENEALLGDLAPGDEIRLELTSGTVLLFRFTERRDVAPGAEFALAQQQPRLTLVLPTSDAWQVFAADYAAEAESMATPPPDIVAEPGQAVQLGQARVTMQRGYLVTSDTLPENRAYYLTEFSVENAGDTPLATSSISIRLRDGMGNTYVASPEASAAGESGPLSGQVQPGASAQASAGFLVPQPLPAGNLTWILSLEPGGDELSVGIPYEQDEDGDLGAPQPQVAIIDAFLDDEGETLIIEGEIRNVGTVPVTIERSEVSLTSSAGISELVMEAPLLPWTVQPGQTQVIELQYERPEASTVLLEVLGYSFEIGGLQ